ncbi:hypothetical protein AVEN_245452-1 [Araneus ventricosus]|uniref:Uncharacterized protein n=1 Tax=Araneus ventricosus TaxID=182803 RepID=A0A4Y2CAK1_ARAVE|nr:hypothetical protein AVEN_245452-1 [Araneus ventricosus]
MKNFGVYFSRLLFEGCPFSGQGREPPEGMQKEEYEEWISIDEDIPVTTTLTDVEICQAVCEQDQAIKVDDSDGDECVEENPPTNAEMRQALDTLKRGLQHRSINLKKIRVRTI